MVQIQFRKSGLATILTQWVSLAFASVATKIHEQFVKWKQSGKHSLNRNARWVTETTSLD